MSKLLKTETWLSTNISGETQVLDYTNGSAGLQEVVVRLDLGDSTKGISGGGQYQIVVYLNNVPLSPIGSVTVTAGVTKTVISSRSIPLNAGDAMKVTVLGRPTDLSVNIIATVRDVTTVSGSELVGDGPVSVDHNYGGPDALAYQTSSGIGIDNADIFIYRRSDYDNGLIGDAYLIARSTTDVNGRWVRPALLDRESYTIQFVKQGAYGTDIAHIVVS